MGRCGLSPSDKARIEFHSDPELGGSRAVGAGPDGDACASGVWQAPNGHGAGRSAERSELERPDGPDLSRRNSHSAEPQEDRHVGDAEWHAQIVSISTVSFPSRKLV
jgi:hypothetical protein